MESACLNAPENGEIEIHATSDKPLQINQPIHLINKSIILRAASGTRPRLLFQLEDKKVIGSGGLIELQSNSSLSLFKLDIEFQIDPMIKRSNPALFTISGEESSLRLSDCSLKVSSDRNKNATLIHLKRPEQLSATVSETAPGSKIDISRCFIHGNSRLCQLDTVVPGSVSITESVIATAAETVYLENSKGTERLKTELSFNRESPETVELNLTRCTLLCGNSFLYLDRTLDKNENMPRIKVLTTDNIFVGKNSDQSFVQTNYSENPLTVSLISTFPERFEWREGSDFIDGFDIYYQNNPDATGSLALPVTRITDWRALWKKTNNRELKSKRGFIQFHNTFEEITFTKLELEAFQLEGTSDTNAAINGSSDGQDDAGAPVFELIDLIKPATTSNGQPPRTKPSPPSNSPITS
ncbi:MAG: hypothetical protein R3C11_03925 [Planctomycetaceae bacterium]